MSGARSHVNKCIRLAVSDFELYSLLKLVLSVFALMKVRSALLSHCFIWVTVICFL